MAYHGFNLCLSFSKVLSRIILMHPTITYLKNVILPKAVSPDLPSKSRARGPNGDTASGRCDRRGRTLPCEAKSLTPKLRDSPRHRPTGAVPLRGSDMVFLRWLVASSYISMSDLIMDCPFNMKARIMALG